MSNKTKVVIITRAYEFLNPDTTSMSEREFFGNPIKEQVYENKTTSPPLIDSLGTSVKKFLAVMDIANKKYKEYINNQKGNQEQWRSFFKTTFDIKVTTKEDGFQKMLDEPTEKVLLAINDVEESGSHKATKNNKCYAVIQHEEFEIYLLLWDQLGRDSSEKIVPFDLFIEQVCKDCNITDKTDPSSGNTNNLLYVHDCQLIGVQCDDTVWDKFDKNFVSPYKNEPYFEVLKQYFDYVAIFGHKSTDGIFQDYILECKFGPTDTDKIALEEANAENFQDLRNKSVNIIE